MKNITVCLNEHCERKNACLRYASSLDNGYYSFMYYICDGIREEHYSPISKEVVLLKNQI